MNKLLPIFAVIISFGSISQSVSPTPDSESQGIIDNADNPKALYTGKPNISIPLHTLNVGDIEIPISISYNASGVKVGQIGSSVGLGWDLNLDGVITREMRGLPDEKVVNPGRSNAWKPVGYLYHGAYTDSMYNTSINGSNSLQANFNTNYGAAKFIGYSSELPVNGLTNDVTANATLAKDTEGDLYHFKFGKYAGTFTFNSLGIPFLLNNNQDLKIEYVLGTGYAAPRKPAGFDHIKSEDLGLIESFTITTPDGIKYIFDQREVTMVFSPNGFFPVATAGAYDPNCLSDSAYTEGTLLSHHVSAWRLSKIESGTNSVEFERDKSIETRSTVSQQSYAAIKRTIMVYSVTETQTIRSLIDQNGTYLLSQGKGAIRPEFYYPPNVADKAFTCDKITIHDPSDSQGEPLKQIEFNFDRFAKTPFTATSGCTNPTAMLDAQRERLKLTSIEIRERTENGHLAQVSPPYVFEYNGTALPPRQSNRIDLWGYFNGNSHAVGTDIVPTLYQYPDDNTIKDTYNGEYSPIRFDTYTGSEIIHPGERRQLNETAMQAGILTKIKLPAGGYTAFEYEANRFYSPANIAPVLGGGLRIKKITRSNGVNNSAENAIITNYNYTNAAGIEQPGQVQSWPAFIQFDPGAGGLSFSYYCSGAGTFASSVNQGVVAASSGSNVLYPFVTVEKEGAHGKTSYEFDVPISFSSNQIDTYNGQPVYERTRSSIFNFAKKANSPYAPNPNYNWRIALKEKRIINESGILVQKTNYEYEIANVVKIPRIRWRFWKRSSSLSQPISLHEYTKYYDISGCYRLKATRVFTYDTFYNQGDVVEKVTEYGYSNQHKNVVEYSVINSDGNKHITRIKYPFDYNSPPPQDLTTSALAKMKSDYINNIPIEKIQLIQEPSGYEHIIGGTINKPTINALTGNSVPHETWKIETSLPIIVPGVFTMSSVSNLGFQMNNNYQRQSTIEKFNKFDLPTQFRREYDQPSSIIWRSSGNTSALKMASASNATRNDIGFTSFEEVLHDEWSFPINASNKVSAGGHTGTKHFSMNTEFGANGVFEVSKQSGKYTCTAWVRTNSGARLVMTSRKRGVVGRFPSTGPSYQQIDIPNTGGKWKEVEIEIDLGAIQPYNPGTPLLDVHFYVWNYTQQLLEIDDIRFRPSSTPMTSTVYNLKELPVATFDENNHFQTYEYSPDDLIKFIRNEDGDIILAKEEQISNNPATPSYSKTITVKSQGKKLEQDISYLGYTATDEWSYQISYYDGLMRPMQHQLIDASPNKDDVILPIKYSNYGQKTIDYLPYSVNQGYNSIAYRTNDVNEQANFSSMYYQDVNAFTTSIYDQSPLNRVKAIRPPGGQFASHPSNLLPSVNTGGSNGSNEVRLLNGFAVLGFYPSESLLISETQDAKGNKVWVYTDLIGRVILKKVENAGVSEKTYYMYSKMGDLLGIIPPEQTKYLDDNNWSGAALVDLLQAPKNQLYLYSYDERHRLIGKLTPEGAEEYIYDRLDRIVLNRDLELKKSNQWRFNKYDEYGRTIITGLYTHSDNQRPVLTSSANLFEIKNKLSSTGYTNRCFPINNLDIHVVNYFDSYDYDADGVADVQFSQLNNGNFTNGTTTYSDSRKVELNKLFGLATGRKIMVLDNSGSILSSSIFYNRYNQSIQSVIENHLEGADKIDVLYDFEGKVLERYHLHTAKIQGVVKMNTIHETYAYDHQGRLLSQTHKINNEPVVTLMESTYGALGEHTDLWMHKQSSTSFLERMSFARDIQGRLYKLGSYGTGGSGFFKEDLTYDVNSNVASTRFEMAVTRADGLVDMCPSCPPVDLFAQKYDFSYDIHNRLTKADNTVEIRFTGQSNIQQNPGRYSVDNISYNLNGDLLSLDRKGLVGFELGPGGLGFTNGLENGAGTLNKPNTGTIEEIGSEPMIESEGGKLEETNTISTIRPGNSAGKNEPEKGTIDSGLNNQENLTNTNTPIVATPITPKETVAKFDWIDQLTYSYHQGRLVGVSDAAKNDLGFIQTAQGVGAVNPAVQATHEYLYNDNGHLIQDKNKGISEITYNHLNLATSMKMNNTANQINWTYNSTGQKVRKTTNTSGAIVQRDYVGIFQYVDNELESIATPFGRAIRLNQTNSNGGNVFQYEYSITDHQGNVRMTISDVNSDGVLTKDEVLQQNQYYPFGMKMQGVDDHISGVDYLFQYGGKEMQKEFDLNLLDYGPRFYDPSMARWHAPDILMEKYHNISPFAYVSNNPSTFSDPTGMSPAVDDDDHQRELDDYELEHLEGQIEHEYQRLMTQFTEDMYHEMKENYYDEILGDGSKFYDDVEPEEPRGDSRDYIFKYNGLTRTIIGLEMHFSNYYWGINTMSIRNLGPRLIMDRAQVLNSKVLFPLAVTGILWRSPKVSYLETAVDLGMVFLGRTSVPGFIVSQAYFWALKPLIKDFYAAPVWRYEGLGNQTDSPLGPIYYPKVDSELNSYSLPNLDME